MSASVPLADANPWVALSMTTVAMLFVLGAVDQIDVGPTERALLVLAAMVSAVAGMSVGFAVG